MFRYHRAAMAALACAAMTAPGLALADCKLLQVAEFKLDPKSYAPVVEGSINDHPVRVLIDSGATFSMITAHEADRQGLVTAEMVGMRAYGIGGDTQVYDAHIDHLKIGDFTKADVNLEVAGDKHDDSGVGIVLGDDALSKFDIEFDLADHVIRLFKPQGCKSPQLVYWGAAYSQVDMLTADPQQPAIQAKAVVNGKPALAEIDSGAELSLMDALAAQADGVSRPATTDGADTLHGTGPRPQQTWVGRFDTFALGDEKISHIAIQVAPFSRGMSFTETGSKTPRHIGDTPALFVGDDFLHAHRVFVDNEDHLILFSYQGGPVFSVAQAASAAPTAPTTK